MPSPADWQLPPGVSRELWDCVHDAGAARGYDAALASTRLLDIDRRFVARHLPEPCRVIDLGCGTGRLAVSLAAAGFEVTAVDLSAEMLRVCGEKAAAAGVELFRVRANLVELDGLRDGRFDAALCLFGTLGMVAGDVNRRGVLAHAFRLLRPGGRFLLHVHNRWFNLGTRAGRRRVARDVLRTLLRRPDAGDWRMPDPTGLGGWVMHLFTRAEVVGMLRQAGFRVRAVEPVSLRADGRLPAAWCLGRLRAYGYLLAAEKPA
jgi:ubiquinone/menaquinone biosynthesis C-methylase UbiE